MQNRIASATTAAIVRNNARCKRLKDIVLVLERLLGQFVYTQGIGVVNLAYRHTCGDGDNVANAQIERSYRCLLGQMVQLSAGLPEDGRFATRTGFTPQDMVRRLKVFSLGVAAMIGAPGR